jgi:hypothetical protein
MSENQPVTLAKPRLQFIDMARSIAIIMMLEGHFTGAALSFEYRKDDFLAYRIWHNIHGLTSPLFFTVTGLVFVYLLCKEKNTSFLKSERVSKGFNRVRMLLFWGYFIQFNISVFFIDLYYGFRSVFNGWGWNFTFHFEWLQAFHVLQSIGIGILLLLLIYGVRYLIGKGEMHWYYLVGSLLIFIAYANLKNFIQLDEERLANIADSKPAYWPSGFPLFIQNMFYGQYSDFSILRYSGYVLLGGMLGSIIRKYEDKTRENWFGIMFIFVGGILIGLSQLTFVQIDNFVESIGLTKHGVFELNATSFIRFGQVVSLLGVLMLIDGNFKIKAPLFLKLGQNTLPIYIVHVILLYGGILGFGLKPLAFNSDLGPWSSITVSLLAIAFFVVMIYFIEPLEIFYNKQLNRIKFRKKS